MYDFDGDEMQGGLGEGCRLRMTRGEVDGLLLQSALQCGE